MIIYKIILMKVKLIRHTKNYTVKHTPAPNFKKRAIADLREKVEYIREKYNIWRMFAVERVFLAYGIAETWPEILQEDI